MYKLLHFFFKLLSRTPFGVLYVISDLLYYPLFYIVRYRRGIVRKNLTECYPDKSLAEIKRIEKKFYHFFCDMALESVKMLTISPEAIGRRMNFVNIGEVNAVLAQGKSIAVFIGHYANWEWITSIGLLLNDDAESVQIYHKLSNPTMDKLIKVLRERMGNKCVEMRSTARFMTNAIRTGKPHIIGFVADQAPRKKDSKYYLHFLNHHVPVLTGTEKLVKHYGYEAMYLSVHRVKRGYYECEFTPLHDNPKSLPDFVLTDLYYKKLEEEIEKQPELYLWSHNRFRGAIKKMKLTRWK